MMSDHAKLIREEIEQSERTRDSAPPTGGTRHRKSREASSVYSVRLRDETIAELQVVADGLDVPVSALIRGFILEGLAAREGGNLRTALERLERDIVEVRRQALSA